MKEKVICGIQQVGIGVESVSESWKWYIKYFGVDIKIFADEGTASLMLPYTGGKPQPRYAVLAYNLRGGAGFEIWEPRGRNVNYPKKHPVLGDLGIFVCKIKAPDVQAAYLKMKEDGVNLLSQPHSSPTDVLHFFLQDPWGNLFEVEQDSYTFVSGKSLTGGGNGVILGVSDMDKSIEFYGKILDYDTVRLDVTGVFTDFKGLPGAATKVRRVVLQRSKPLQGPMSAIMGTSQLELVQNLEEVPSKIYEGRFWGDPGFIHLCFDVRNMDKVREACEALGHPFVCDSDSSLKENRQGFDMGDANGHFTYVEDPSGTLIEFVETLKVPIYKKWNLALNLAAKDDKKQLPKMVTRALRFLRVKASDV